MRLDLAHRPERGLTQTAPLIPGPLPFSGPTVRPDLEPGGHTHERFRRITLTHEHLIACHHTGTEATVRVEFDVDIPGQPRQHEVLAVRLVKSAWWPADSHLVG